MKTPKRLSPKIKIVGIGGAGSNTVSRLMRYNLEGIELIALNTDEQDLKRTSAHLKIRIGRKLTQGLGTGMNPKLGEKAAEEQKEEIKEALKGAELIFITLGEGGGTGSGAAPVIAEISRELKILSIGIVSRPFSFEGNIRRKIAENGIRKLKENLDSLIVIPNDKLLLLSGPEASISDAFWKGDEILREAVLGITDLVTSRAIINVGLASVKSVLKNSGRAVFGTGEAEGEKRAEKAAAAALSCPLVEISPKGAKRVLFNVSGRNISLGEIEEIAKFITKEVSPEAKITFGAKEDLSLKKGKIKVNAILTDF